MGTPHSHQGMGKLDAEALGRALRDAFSEAWAAFRRAYPEDRVYGLGAYTSDEAAYVGMTVFSEAGLEEVATEYADESGTEVEEEAAQLRWSPCDSPHHLFRADLFEDAQKILDGARGNRSKVTGAFRVFVDVLRSLDSEGVFGESRSEMVLSIWIGDQSDSERIEYARRLNPREVADRFEAELEGEEFDDWG